MAASIGGYAPAFWLATDKYDDAPKKQSRDPNDGTKPPIRKDFKSPWIERKLDEMVEWLKGMPEDIDLNAHYFGALDNGAKRDPPTIVVCRIGDVELKGDKLFLLRKDSIKAVEHLVGAQSDAWDELTRHGEKNAEIEYSDNAA